MMKLHKLALAKKDLVDIWLYSAEHWGVALADQYLDALESAFKTITLNPEIGVLCDELVSGHRKYHVKKHVIFYKTNKKTLSVVRVLNASIDHTSRMK